MTLSATYELDDIKNELNDYRTYDYNDKSFTQIGDTTLDSTTVSSLDSTAEILRGYSITGTGIAASTTVKTVDGVDSLTLSAAATANGTDITFTFTQGGNSLFETDINAAISKVVYERMYPVVGTSYYATLAALDKTGLDSDQIYIYWAEVFYSVAEFMMIHSKREQYKRRNANESRTQGDVTFSTTGQLGKTLAADEYFSKGDFYFARSGYDIPNRLKRRETIHGN